MKIAVCVKQVPDSWAEKKMVNGVLANEKKQRDLEMHQEWAKLEAREIEYTNNTDFMTENPATEVSMLAPHRVKPYHFKGFKF